MSARRRDANTTMNRMLQPAIPIPGQSGITSPGLPSLHHGLISQGQPLRHTADRHSPSARSLSSASSSAGSRSPSPPSPALSLTDYRDVDVMSSASGSRSPWNDDPQPRLGSRPRHSSDSPALQPYLGRARSGSYAPSPMNVPYPEEAVIKQNMSGLCGGRPRSCSLAGCDCQPMTSLRPAFPDSDGKR